MLTHLGLLGHDGGGWNADPLGVLVAVMLTVAVVAWIVWWLIDRDSSRSVADKYLLERLASERPESQLVADEFDGEGPRDRYDWVGREGRTADRTR